MNKNFSDYLTSDNIDLDEALNMAMIMKRIQQVKQMHPYTISHTEKSGWFTE